MVTIMVDIASLEHFRKIASYMDSTYRGQWNATSKIRKRLRRLHFYSPNLRTISEPIKLTIDMNPEEKENLRIVLGLLQ